MTRHPPAPTTPAQPPPTWARRAGHVAWMAPVLGFIPLHVPWILGIPMFADPHRFREWYHGRGPGVGEHPVDGFLGLPAGAFYLGLLCVLAGLGGVLALGLIKDWGLPLLLAWTFALPVAGWSYYRRTRPPGPVVPRGSRAN